MKSLAKMDLIMGTSKNPPTLPSIAKIPSPEQRLNRSR
jgi:hypothetical protein